jgi:hypothetical protein
MRRACLLTCLLIGWPGLAAGQTIKTPADVMPAKAIGYIELRQPGQLVKEVQSLFEGSILSNPDALAKLQEKYKLSSFRRGPEEMLAASLLLAPEIPAEIGRMQGAAVAITGIDKEDRDMPEFVAVILPGDSNLLRLMWRAAPLAIMSGYASFDGKTRIEGTSRFESVGEVEGVRIYRMKTRERRTPAAGGGAPEDKVREQGPAVAMLPDALLVGSPERVKEVIGRAKGKVQTPALSGTMAYQEASRGMGDRPGIFSLGDVQALLAAVDQLPIRPDERQVFDAIKKLVNPAALESVSQSLALSAGTLQLRWHARFDPKEKSRVLDLLPGTGINPEMLHFLPRDATALLAVSNADGEQRFGNLVNLANEIHQATRGGGPMPSEELERLEQAIRIKIGKDIMGRIHSVAIAMRAPTGISDLVPPPVVAVVQGTNEAAAKSLLEETIPHFYSLVMNAPGLKADTQEVQGQTVYGLPFVNYGRQGATLVIATKPELVAEALNNGVKKQGLLSDEKIAARLTKSEGTIVFLAAKPLTMASKSLPLGLVFMPAQERAIAIKLVAPIQQLAKNEEPIVLHVTRTRDAITAEFVVSGLKEIVPKAVDVGVEMYYQMSAQHEQRFTPPTKTPRPPEVRPKELERKQE